MKSYKGKKPEDMADELGAAYTKAKADEKAAKTKADEAVVTIKDMAKAVGTTIEKETTVTGTRFTVGYSQPDASPSIDEAKLERMVTPAVWKRLLVLTVDPKKFVALTEAGVIPKKTAEAVLIPGTPPTPRVVVKAI